MVIPCAVGVFNQMEDDVLNAIKAIILSAKSELVALKAQKEALSLSIDYQLIPLQAKRIALDTLISEARSKTKIIPPYLVTQCPALGSINTTLEAALMGRLEGAENLLFETDRLISEKTATQAQATQLDAGAKFLDDVVETIDEVLSTT